jgi:hypothetical protein
MRRNRFNLLAVVYSNDLETERRTRGQMYLSRREANRLRGIRAANESEVPVAEWVDGD